MHLFSAYLLFIILASGYGDKTVGFPERITDEYENAECNSKGVPTWIKGTFIRHQCGTFGSPKGAGYRTISHFYDCIGMLNAFMFDNGRVTFSSKYFDSDSYSAWNPKNRNVDTSSLQVSWKTLYAAIDQPSFDSSQTARSTSKTPNTVDASPLGDVWQIDSTGCQLSGYSDAPDMYTVNLQNGQLNNLQRKLDWSNTNLDNSAPWPTGSIVLHNSPHAHRDEAGNLWGVMLMARSKSTNIYELYHMIYKFTVGMKTRQLISDALPSVTVDLTKCTKDPVSGTWSYSSTDDGVGFIGEVSSTKTYLILIENSYIFNPCALRDENKNAAKPFLDTWFDWKDTQLKIHVITKSDQTLKYTVTFSPSAFISQTINIVEDIAGDGGYIVVDVIAHPDASVLKTYYGIENLMSSSNWPSDASVRRYSIDPTTGRGVVTDSLLPSTFGAVIPAEFVEINENMRGDPTYAYVYILVNPFSDGSQIWKVNVRDSSSTSTMLRTTTDAGIYLAGKPTFVPKSNKTSGTNEDDGVVIVPAFNSDNKKGLLLIYDATNLNEVGRVELPDLITYGTYSRFIQTCNQARSNIKNLFLIISILMITWLIL